jgi:hypothetical protein
MVSIDTGFPGIGPAVSLEKVFHMDAGEQYRYCQNSFIQQYRQIIPRVDAIPVNFYFIDHKNKTVVLWSRFGKKLILKTSAIGAGYWLK